MAKLTRAQKMARYECFEEALAHLELCWTDDPNEITQVPWVAAFLDRQAQLWYERAMDTPPAS